MTMADENCTVKYYIKCKRLSIALLITQDIIRYNVNFISRKIFNTKMEQKVIDKIRHFAKDMTREVKI